MDSITDAQRITLTEFCSRIKDVRKSIHDENYLLKWLKARKFDLQKTEDMYRQSMAWRDEVGADTILESYRVPEVMTKYYPGGLCGHDKIGRPIWIDPLGKGDLKGIMHSVKKSDVLKTLVWRLENLYAEFRRCSEESGCQIDQCVHIIDMAGLGARFMWKPALNLYIEVMKMLEKNYPETLKRTYIINAPRIFRVGFNVLKQFIDKDTARKFKFCDSNWQETIAHLIDQDQLPVFYGGIMTDPDGNVKCESRVCYGGQVPVEYYRQKEDFFPPNCTPQRETLGRGGTLTLAYTIPDTQHALSYVFTVDTADVEFAVFTTPFADGKCPDESQLKQKKVPKLDLSKTQVVQQYKKVECERVPEDGLIFFDKAGTYYIQFRNPSRVWRRTLTFTIEVDRVDDGDHMVEVSKETFSGAAVSDDTQL